LVSGAAIGRLLVLEASPQVEGEREDDPPAKIQPVAHDGGGVALEPDPLKCEGTSGPSHVEDGGGDALQRISGDADMDRSSPIQDKRFRAGVDRHNVDTIPEDSS
jgi:hypothetical protein